MANASALLVSIGIPLYRSRRFVDRIIRNIEAIDYPNAEVIVSDRHGEDDAIDIIGERFRHDARVRIVRANDLLTWVQHYNELLYIASGTYFMWMPHDDEFPAAYVSQLAAELETHSDAVLAYGRLERVDLEGQIFRTGVDSDPEEGTEPWSPRAACSLLIDRRTERPFRGLFRREVALRSRLYIRSALDDIAADAYWVFALALLGPFRYVSQCSCRKSYYAESTHARWKPMHLGHIVDGRRVLLSYVQTAVRDRRDARYCTLAVNQWTLLAIAGVTARRCGISEGFRRSAERFLSRTVAQE